MKLIVELFRKRFTITEEEMDEYYAFYWLPEVENIVDDQGNLDNAKLTHKLDKLKKSVKWIMKISEKYNTRLMRAHQWHFNPNTREITIISNMPNKNVEMVRNFLIGLPIGYLLGLKLNGRI